jgi:hypothetical protein
MTGNSSAQISDTDALPSVIPNANDCMTEETSQKGIAPTRFHSRYTDYMEMYANAQTVASYFDDHAAWFQRCAHPMKAEPISKDGYVLVIGKFGSFGYQVEPKVALDLLPQQEGMYRIETIPVPNQVAQNYDVDFRASLELIEVSATQSPEISNGLDTITRVQWDLNLTVTIQFPRFIRALPKSLVQNTGDCLLNQIIRQVSKRLNRKVLEDFHKTHNVPIPDHNQQWFLQKAENDLDLGFESDLENIPAHTDCPT